MNDSDRILRLRHLLSQSQRELADTLGVTPGAIAHWELGKRKVPGPVVKLLEIYEEQIGLSRFNNGPEVLENLKTSWHERGFAVTRLSAQMTVKLFWLGLGRLWQSEAPDAPLRRQLYAAFGKKAATVLGELKGLPHKLGQLLSYMDFDIPDDVRKHFRLLQSDTPALPAHQILDIFLVDFRKSPQQLFSKWEPHAVAAASMGQVHRARGVHGEDLAVKVQYPDLRRIVETDISHLAILEKMSTLILRGHDAGTVVNELRSRFLEECDYTLEQQNLEMFRKLFSKHEAIRIPKTYPKLCSTHVLTTEFLPGLHFDAFLRTASRAEKNAAARTIWEFVWTCLIKHRRFSADPHPGNYIFMGKGRIGFLDFGCVKTIPDATFKIWTSFLRCVAQEDKTGLIACLEKLGVAPSRDLDATYWLDLMRFWYGPCFDKMSFRFTRKFVKTGWQKMTTQNPSLRKIRFPRELIFLNHVQWGLYALLAELDAEGHWDLSGFLEQA